MIAAAAGGVLIALGMLATPQGVTPAATSQPATSTIDSDDMSAARKAGRDEELKNEGWIAKAKDAIKDRLKDPGSAEFRRLVVSRTGSVPVVCGEVSSKNSFGGRNGFQRVVSAARPDLTFLEEEVGDMDSVWRKFC